jgi:hypothetical protein
MNEFTYHQRVCSVERLDDLCHVNTNIFSTVIVKDGLRGGVFIYAPSLPKLLHDGGVCIDPEKLDQNNKCQDDDGKLEYGIYKRQFEGNVHVNWFGADPSGKTDSTEAIENCFAFCFPTNRRMEDSANWNILSTGKVQFGVGTYKYNGTGFNSESSISFSIVGMGLSLTRILLGRKSRLINHQSFVSSCYISDIYFTGGKGVYIEKRSKPNISQGAIIERCSFVDFTECAIGFENPVDSPRLVVRDCTFTASPVHSTIAVVLPPGGGHEVRHNWFNSGQIDIKICGNQLGECSIQNNRFGKLSSFTLPRNNIWIVPSNNTANCGRGINVSNNMFGNENLNTEDNRVIIADEDYKSGNGYHNRQISKSKSVGYLYGFFFRDNVFSGNKNMPKQIVKNYCINIGEYFFTYYLDGNVPEKLIDYVYGYDDKKSRQTDVYVAGLFKNSDLQTAPFLEWFMLPRRT